MFPLANTGMDTALLRGREGPSGGGRRAPTHPREGPGGQLGRCASPATHCRRPERPGQGRGQAAPLTARP